MIHKLGHFLEQRIMEEWAPCISVALADARSLRASVWKGETDSRMDGQSRPIDADTRFNIGSVTKPVTASLICKLIELGELTFMDKVRRVIPEYPFEDACIWHLMTHSVGYDEQYQPGWPSRQDGIDGYLKRIYEIEDKPYAAGERSGYFTNGYSILMDVIQRVTGASLENFARETLFEPLGMSRTSFEYARVREENVVFPVLVDGHRTLESSEFEVTGDSGLYSTAEDLVKFGQMFLSEGAAGGRELFRPGTIAFMLRPCASGMYDYTPAFWYKKADNANICFADASWPGTVGHTGYSGCMLWIDPIGERTGAIVTNSVRMHSDWTRYIRINNALTGYGG